jgi:hypothetical protein
MLNEKMRLDFQEIFKNRHVFFSTNELHSALEKSQDTNLCWLLIEIKDILTYSNIKLVSGMVSINTNGKCGGSIGTLRNNIDIFNESQIEKRDKENDIDKRKNILTTWDFVNFSTIETINGNIVSIEFENYKYIETQFVKKSTIEIIQGEGTLSGFIKGIGNNIRIFLSTIFFKKD